DDLETFKRAQVFMKRTMPAHLPVLKHYVGKKNVFSKYQTEEQIEVIYGRTILLPSGGAIVIDQTEALVAIDVNSGKTTGDNQEDTALKTNLDAAIEIARQLRLRDLAGLIAIDFIDMKRETNIKSVQSQLVDHLKEDKARMEVGKINRFGVLIMTRQRIRPSLQHINHESCINCRGTGKVKTKEAVMLECFRKIRSAALREEASRLSVRMSSDIGLLMLNSKRADIHNLELKHRVRIEIHPDHSLHASDFFLEIEKNTIVHEPTTESLNHSPLVITPPESESTQKVTREAKSRPSRVRHNTGKQDRDKQRAALTERERLRSLFHEDKTDTVEIETPSKPANGFDIIGSIKSSVDSLVRKAKQKNKKSSVKVTEQQEPPILE
ncbi:MAG: ribonuclease E/G, partial [Holophagaceae bacterium]